MRATVEQALGRVQEYITALEDESVPTSLLRERVKAIRAWGVGVEARGSSGGGSKSQQIRNIQEKLDKMKDSEMYVRAQRATCPWYPYESEEQQRMALVCEKHTNQQGTEDLFKSLHGGKGKRSLLAADLQSPENKRLLSARSIEVLVFQMGFKTTDDAHDHLGLKYMGKDAARDFLFCLCFIIREWVNLQARNSPMVGIMVDESTDISQKKVPQTAATDRLQS